MNWLSVDAEGDVVLGCGGRTLQSPPYTQTVPLLPLGRPHRAALLPKRPVNFPLSQDFFHAPLGTAHLGRRLDAAALATGKDQTIDYISRPAAKPIAKRFQLGTGENRHLNI